MADELSGKFRKVVAVVESTSKGSVFFYYMYDEKYLSVGLDTIR